MIDYAKWSDEYEQNASQVLGVIEREKARLNDQDLPKETREALRSRIIEYRRIYRDLLHTASHLRLRARAFA